MRVGLGTFGLQEWGLVNDITLANAAYRILKEAQRPLTKQELIAEVLNTWCAKESSIIAAINMDPERRFYWFGEKIGLREWVIEGGKASPKGSLKEFFKDIEQQYAVESARSKTLIESEVDKIANLDFHLLRQKYRK